MYDDLTIGKWIETTASVVLNYVCVWRERTISQSLPRLYVLMWDDDGFLMQSFAGDLDRHI
jgi:hypothetical protein